MEIFESLLQFFGIESISTIEDFAAFMPWFVKVILAVIIVGVFIRCFFSAMVEVSRGIR